MKKLLLITTFIASANFCHAQAWSAMGNGFDGDVNAFCIYNNALYAAGNFTHDGSGSTTLNHIARWTGSSWVAVGTGVDGNVSAMTVYHDTLYVGGDFNNAGGTGASKIARWAGSGWSAVGSGFNNTVKCLYVWNNELYVGGSFTMDGGSITAIPRVAKLTGNTWEAIGNLTSGIVNAMIDFNGELYIGGTWSVPYMNKLSGSSWVALTTTGAPDLAVNALAVFKYSGTDALWLGGQFSAKMKTYSAGGSFGSSFNPFSGGDVNALCGTQSFLYAGGGFTVNSASRIARYNGAAPWDTVGVTPNGDINAFTVFNGHLVAGGQFTTMGSAAKRVAIRNTLIGLDELTENILVNEFFPNPFDKEATLKIQTKSKLTQPGLKMLDITGRDINQVIEMKSFNQSTNEIEYRIQRSGLPSGIYFYTLSNESMDIARGKFIIQ